jgi:hypothetical protein
VIILRCLCLTEITREIGFISRRRVRVYILFLDHIRSSVKKKRKFKSGLPGDAFKIDGIRGMAI